MRPVERKTGGFAPPCPGGATAPARGRGSTVPCRAPRRRSGDPPTGLPVVPMPPPRPAQYHSAPLGNAVYGEGGRTLPVLACHTRGYEMDRRTILVVDDHAPTREAYASFLLDCGYRVVEAGHGGEAILHIH